MKSKNSSGNDDISNRLLKSIKCEISKPLTIIINQSLETGIFPDALKVAKVKPLFKKGDNCCLNNYRPISLLPTISKIFERVMYTQLYYYFNVNNLLSEQQYGFRSQHSTELASVKLVDFILKEMDNIRDIKIPASIFLDLSKAFDTLNFDILLRKLQHYGIDGNSLNLIKSYLTNRFQYVQFENSDSSLLEVKTGIPQGSILGPLFFSILINDLVNCSTKFQFLMYADDTTIYFNLNDFPLINREIKINSELEKVNTWLKLNKLAIKGECSVFLIFFLLWMKTMHYPNTIRSHLVTIVPVAPFTPKSTSKLRSALHIRYSKVIPRFISRANTAQTNNHYNHGFPNTFDYNR